MKARKSKRSAPEMNVPVLDLDLAHLARQLKAKMETENLSLRAAANEIGCSPATLSRLLMGSSAPNYPDTKNLFRAISWLGKRVGDFERGQLLSKPKTTFADVEIHLRALPGLSEKDKEALVAIVGAAYYATLRTKKS
jgi:transcriptional regulator with XRE-family HTH domain